MDEIVKISASKSRYGYPVIELVWLGEKPLKVSVDVPDKNINEAELWDIVQLLIEHARMEAEA